MSTLNSSPPWVYYFSEFRKRLLRSLGILVVFFAGFSYFANPLYTLLENPLLKRLPQHTGLIATNVVSPFFVPFELAFVAACFTAMPLILYQLWAFIAPALYRHERRLVWPLLLVSILLFYTGVAFAYFLVLPLLFTFITHTLPMGVTLSPDISQYLDFMLKMFLVFGLIFEVPIITVLIIYTGLVSREKLIKLRPYIIVGSFIAGMLLAPPDVISQCCVAIPLWLLFELGILLSQFAFFMDNK